MEQVDLMCGKIGARLLAPSRCSDLGLKEEKVRCELSWQQMEQRIWIAGVAKQEDFGNWVVDPKRFIENRENTWLVLSDQIPVCVQKVCSRPYTTRSRSTVGGESKGAKASTEAGRCIEG